MFINPVSCNYNTSFQADGDVIYRNGIKYVRKEFAKVEGPILKLTRSDLQRIDGLRKQSALALLDQMKFKALYMNARLANEIEYYYSLFLKAGFEIQGYELEIEDIKKARHRKQIANEERKRQKMLLG